MKVRNYTTISSIGTTTTTTLKDVPAEQSFEDVLVLNQSALKAMTIDAMIDESPTGTVNPDAVDAAAIMRFRSTLGSNVVAPIPEDKPAAKVPTAQIPVAQEMPATTPATPPTMQEVVVTPPVTQDTTNTTEMPSTPVTGSNTNTDNTVDEPTRDSIETLANKIVEILTDKVGTPATNTEDATKADVQNTTPSEDSITEPLVQTIIDSFLKQSSGSPAVDEADVASVYNEGKLKCKDEYNAYFLAASKEYGVDAKLLKAICYTESSFNPNSTSSVGAMGLMQLMPSTAKYLGVEDAYDPQQNIMGGAKYIAHLIKKYDGDIETALSAYNTGPGNVAKYGGIPSYTRKYVNKVMGLYQG